jgi:hypothetical protein
MSKIYNKHMDQVIRSVEPTLGQEKTKAFKRNLESKKIIKKGVIDPTLKAEEVRKYKAKGGRIGLKSGTNPFVRKSNIKKIQEVFGPKQVKKKEKPKARMMAKKGTPDPKKKKKFPDLNKDGKTTFADVLIGRGVINGKKKPKKKVI